MKAEYIDHMGDDLSIVNAAKVSFSKESDWVCSCGDTNWVHDYDYDLYCGNCNTSDPVLSGKDTGLINYLAKHNHWTPFAHNAIKLRMKAPVPIRTHCFKHKEGLVENEESRRYIASTPEVFIPKFFRSKPEGNIKQGSYGHHLSSDDWLAEYTSLAAKCVNTYNKMIKDGVCPEQARFVLPQGCEVSWIWTGNLASFARFYNQRTDPHAQKEVQDLAKEVGKVIEPLFPVGWAALTNKGEEE